jgi:hypothetical protein
MAEEWISTDLWSMFGMITDGGNPNYSNQEKSLPSFPQ